MIYSCSDVCMGSRLRSAALPRLLAPASRSSCLRKACSTQRSRCIVFAAKKGADGASSNEGAPNPEDVEQLEKMYGNRKRRPSGRVQRYRSQTIQPKSKDSVQQRRKAGSALSELLAQGEEAARSGKLDQEALATLVAEASGHFESLSAQARAGEEASAKLQPLEEQIKAANDKYLRLNADFDNFRKRTSKEKDQIADRTKGDTVKSLIPLVDSFEAAQNSIKPETDGEKKISNAYQGLYKQMVETFKSLGVEAVPGVGQPFDPNFHDAIAREDNDEFPDGTVLKEFRRGFRLGNTLLRPAMVQVSASDKPAAKPQGEDGASAEAGAIDVEVNEV